MKKLLKSMVSMVLALTMLVSLCIGTAANAKEVKKETPVIFVHGFAGSDIYDYAGTKDETLMWSDIQLDKLTDKTIANIQKLVDMEAKGELTLTETNAVMVFDIIGDILALFPTNLDDNGNPMYGSDSEHYFEPLSKHPEYFDSSLLNDTTVGEHAYVRDVANKIGSDNTYAFLYDWRRDVVELAEQLDDYVDLVKKQTGSKTVKIEADSEGGNVLSAYLDKHMYDGDVDMVFLTNPAFQGVSVTGLYNKDLKVNPNVMATFVREIGETFLDGNLAGATNLLSLIGPIYDVVAYLMNTIGEDEVLLDAFYMDILKDFFGNWAATYEFIPYAKFDDAMQKMTDLGFLQKKGLYQKLQRYHKLQGRTYSNLQKASKVMDVVIWANYGTSAIPITSDAILQADVLVDTKYASAGATVANFGETLNVKDGKYVSPDHIIDASTCALPDNTWFFKDLMHVMIKTGTEPAKLMTDILTGEVAPNVAAVQKKYGYSQFMTVDTKNNHKLANVTAKTEVEQWNTNFSLYDTIKDLTFELVNPNNPTEKTFLVF